MYDWVLACCTNECRTALWGTHMGILQGVLDIDRALLLAWVTTDTATAHASDSGNVSRIYM